MTEFKKRNRRREGRHEGVTDKLDDDNEVNSSNKGAGADLLSSILLKENIEQIDSGMSKIVMKRNPNAGLVLESWPTSGSELGGEQSNANISVNENTQKQPMESTTSGVFKNSRQDFLRGNYYEHDLTNHEDISISTKKPKILLDDELEELLESGQIDITDSYLQEDKSHLDAYDSDNDKERSSLFQQDNAMSEQEHLEENIQVPENTDNNFAANCLVHLQVMKAKCDILHDAAQEKEKGLLSTKFILDKIQMETLSTEKNLEILNERLKMLKSFNAEVDAFFAGFEELRKIDIQKLLSFSDDLMEITAVDYDSVKNILLLAISLQIPVVYVVDVVCFAFLISPQETLDIIVGLGDESFGEQLFATAILPCMHLVLSNRGDGQTCNKLSQFVIDHLQKIPFFSESKEIHRLLDFCEKSMLGDKILTEDLSYRSLDLDHIRSGDERR